MHILKTHLNHFFYLFIQFVCKLEEESLTTSGMKYFDECKASAAKFLISSKCYKLLKNTL